MSNTNPKKPVFLYVIIALLSLALVVLGAFSAFSMIKLGNIQQELTSIQQTALAASDSASIATQKAEEITELQQQLNDALASQDTTSTESAAATDNASADAVSEDTDTSEVASEDEVEIDEDGTLSPNSGSVFTEQEDSNLNLLITQLQDLVPQDNGNWSIYVCNLLKGSENAINNAPMQAASLIKLFIMGTVYENYNELTQQHGKETVDQQLNIMITVSDNDAANTLVTWLGGGDAASGMQRVNSFCQAHGYNDTSMGRLLLQSNEYGDNYTSVDDCGRFLKEIYQINNGTSSTNSLQGAEAMYYLLKCQQRRNKIPAGIPEGIGVANKTGELSNVENDAAIIYNTAKGIDLVIVFMSENLSSPGTAQTTIANMSHMIYGYYNE